MMTTATKDKTKPRRLVLRVALTFDEWTARAIGTDAQLIRDLRDDLTNGHLGGVRVYVAKLSSTEEED